MSGRKTRKKAEEPIDAPSHEVVSAQPFAKELEAKFRELMEVNQRLIIKVATFECPWAKKCPLFELSKRIAKCIDDLHELRDKMGG